MTTPWCNPHWALKEEFLLLFVKRVASHHMGIYLFLLYLWALDCFSCYLRFHFIKNEQKQQNRFHFFLQQISEG